jgi:hypothetical protein
MAEIYLYLFALICAGLLIWGLIRLERIYQYPFFMGSIFVAFILPQAIALNKNSGLPDQQALERVLLMSCLCAAMCFLGYQCKPNPKFVKSLNIDIDEKKLFRGAVVFTIIGYICNILIKRLLGGTAEISINNQWTGVITIYNFFGQLIYPAFTIFILLTLQRFTAARLLLTVIAFAIPLEAIVLGGRREVIGAIVLTFGLALYFCLQYLPSRVLVIGSILFAMVVIPFIGEYRNIASSGDWNRLAETDLLASLQNQVDSGEILELRSGALYMDAAVHSGSYGYGIGYWNILVFQFIPAQLLGKSFKDDLQLRLTEFDIGTLYHYAAPIGLTPTGVSDSFVEFDYFGCLFFFLLGYLFKNVWVSATAGNSIVGRISYISLLAPALKAVTHTTAVCVSDSTFRVIFLGCLFFYAHKRQYRQTYSDYNLFRDRL